METTMNILLKWFYGLTNKSPGSMPMVSYWKRQNSISAKVTKSKDGSIHMVMEGEEEPFPGFPRGHLLFGPLSPLKHEIKNQIFNESWRKLEEGMERKEVIQDIKKTLVNNIIEISKKSKYDMMPPSAMVPAVREIHRAWTKVSPQTSDLRDCLCFILQEDDGYRFRVQWIVKFFGWAIKRTPIKFFHRGLEMLEHAEIVGDMKERIRLLRRILMLILEDESIKKQFTELFKEIDWKKVALSKADKYHFRGKYFKVDYPELEY